jgi:hypothetical protein
MLPNLSTLKAAEILGLVSRDPGDIGDARDVATAEKEAINGDFLALRGAESPNHDMF